MKIVSSYDMARIAGIFKENNKKVVQCHGCFDLIHLGHILHLQEAKSYGDILIVTVTADEFVKKGDGRPVFSLFERMNIIAALECVDFVVPSYDLTSVDIILSIKPNIYVKGIDYTETIPDIEHETVNRIGGAVKYTSSKKYSTTDTIKRIRNEH